MNKVSKLTGLAGALLLGSTIFLGNGEAHAGVASYPYNGLSSTNYNQSMSLKPNAGSIHMKHIKNPKKAGYSAIGRVSNFDGWKGHGKDSMGTGFIIDGHTFITNLHVVQDANGKIARSQDVRMVTERNGAHHKYTFNASSIQRVPHADAVMVHTRQDMSRYVKPLKLASSKTINHLRTGDIFKAPGYDKYTSHGPTNDNTKLWESKGRFLRTTTNGREMMTKQIFRSGGSGSPLLTKDNRVMGISAYGWNLNGTNSNELAGGFKFTNDIRDFIQKHMR